MVQELVPHVDKNDNLLGVVDRQEANEKGLIHRAAHGIIQNSQGLYLVQQRSFQKATWPGHYDLGIAETVKPDEAYDAALLRGLHEELSLDQAPQLQDGEVEKVAWLSQEQVTQLVQDPNQLRTPWLINDWQFYLQHKET